MAASGTTVSARASAREFLRTVLAGGDCLARGILETARLRGTSERTLRRAFRDIGGRARKEGYGTGSAWWWRLRNQSARDLDEGTEGGQPKPASEGFEKNQLRATPQDSLPLESSSRVVTFRPTSSGPCQTCRRWGPLALTQLEPNFALNVCEACHAGGKAAIVAAWVGS